MPASDLFTITGGSYTDYTEHIEKGFISFQLLGSGDITFKQNLTTYFTVIGGGAGGGGSGSGGGGDDRNAGAGGGAGASGKIYFFTVNNVPYSYEVGTGGAGSSGTSDGVNGTNSSITFSVGEKILAEGGNKGQGRLSGGAGGTGGSLVITGLDTIISGTSGDGGDGYIWPGPPTGRAAEDGSGNIPISIKIYPDTIINVGGGGAGGSAADGGDGDGGGGGDGSGGLRYDSLNAGGTSGIAYGGGGGGCGYTTGAFSGGAGKEGAIFVYIHLIDCDKEPCQPSGKESLCLYTYEGTTTNKTDGLYGRGQSFTMSESTFVGKITTTSIGGISGLPLITGIEASYINLREFVNNNETTTLPNALSGTILASSGYGKIINPINPYDGTVEYPVSQFILCPVYLQGGTKYVVEWVVSPPIYVYVSIPGPYSGGQAYDISGINLSAQRDSPMGVWCYPPLLNGCEWNPCLTAETSEWTRAHTDCVDLDGATLHGTAMTYQDLSEKRKATIFQYKNNSAGFSKKQQYSRIARGLGQKKTTYATQSDTYTNPNTNNLVLDASSVLLCPGRVKNWAYSSQNDTPGPMIKITNQPNVPLTNYKVRRTYLAGNNKWPQFGWAPGMDGFPVRKMGKK